MAGHMGLTQRPRSAVEGPELAAHHAPSASRTCALPIRPTAQMLTFSLRNKFPGRILTAEVTPENPQARHPASSQRPARSAAIAAAHPAPLHTLHHCHSGSSPCTTAHPAPLP